MLKALIVLPLTFVFTFAQAANNLPPWLDWGVLGAVIIALVVTKQLVPGWIYTQMKRENESLKEENKKLVDKLLSMGESTIPALKESTLAVTMATDALRRKR